MKTALSVSIRPLALVLMSAGTLSPLASAHAGQDQPDAAAFARGAQAWADNCARCHNMRDPKEFRDDQWRPIVAHMRVRAGLTGQEARDILLFLQSSN